jgi:phage protein U
MLMALWGRFPFGINTAAFQELNRDTSWRWPSHELFGQLPTLQFVGPGDDTITLPGVIYPEFRGGTGQLNAMRAVAAQGLPQLLLDGRGNILGQWVATSISEKQSTFAGFGIPLRQEFTITLKRFPDPLSGNALLNLLSSKIGIDLGNIMRMIDQVKSAVGLIQTGIEQAKALVQTASAVIGAPAAAIISAVNKTINTAESFKQLAVDAAAITGVRPTTASAISGLQTMVTALPGIVAQASAASTAIKASVEEVIANSTPAAGVDAANAALVATNKLTRFSSVTYHSTRTTVAELSES